MELASLEDEDLTRILQLSRLPQQKLKAICVIAGADLE